MNGGLLERLIARADAELAALEADPAAPDRRRRMAELRERRHRLEELRADVLRHSRDRASLQAPGRAAG